MIIQEPQTPKTKTSAPRQMSSDRIRKQWPDFSEIDLMEIAHNGNELKARLKRVYGFSEERADQEFRTFMKPYTSSFEPSH